MAREIKYKTNKEGISTTKCPNGFTTFVGNRSKRVGDDCIECKLVNRLSDHWRMVDRVPQRKCTICGQWLPLHCFYPRTVIRNGRRYEGYEGRCKMCKVETLHRRVVEVRQERIKF